MSNIKVNGQVTITSNASNTLLESLENAGIDAEYNCRDGHCGACRCKLKSGEVEYVGFAMAYTQGDEVLPCVTRAKTDVELEEVVYKLKEKRA
ncbi:class I ribonucleotide reductase maintenance protein YfaE [Vibrio sp. LaRot3]|uniref:class I ribonucleotide reductase maintenance protein YfaE n=1 Tax=Vibrio sp. LaRot3 TaxID=2998829 RepID=UPI0022CE22B8|nr:class I ribonucleotide reductase maintenance protein YfaE [Vibrio sp. LaRot3]MDA0147701.1 class I ribonucleotide reductase maintenance protein YfaE [Vibrio sp. LaRot3]